MPRRPPSPSLPSLSAPGGAGPSLTLPGAGRRLPALDDRIADPEKRIEYVDGVAMYASPASPPHAKLNSRLAYLLEAHTARGYEAAVDLLIRTNETSDFSPDASIFPAGRDPETGGRLLEVLVFEVVDRQSISVPTKKARSLIARGVERVFCIMIKRGRVLEWSREQDGWSTMPEGTQIEHACLLRPLPVSALLDAAGADDAVAQALLDRKVPVLRKALARERAEGTKAGRAEGRKEGEAIGRLEGMRQAIRSLLAVRGIALTRSASLRIAACDEPKTLVEWLHRATTATRAADVVKSEPKPRKRR